MPLVQRVELFAPESKDEKKPKAAKPIAWADTHTKLSGGQVATIVRLHHKYMYVETLAERDEIGWQWDTILLLTEAWSFEDPDKPGEALPKSREGLEKTAQENISALWLVLQPLVETAFPNV